MNTPAASVWNPDNIRDVAESVGIPSLSTDAIDHLTRDVEFRIGQVLEEALKCMRHAKRTTLFTSDISQALRILDQEPLYGYDSTRPLRFGEASIGPGQTLFYLEDEEVDFEKLINAPLPKVPREITFTAHWLAVEGVQPTIPQNPSSDNPRDLLPKGPGANPHAAATAGLDNLSVKPLVKHVLSKELQLYFEHVCGAVLDESNDEYRAAALASLRDDPGLHQLVPYFVHWVAEKVTHSLKNVFVLSQCLRVISALTENSHLHLVPYVAALVPPVLTCLVGRKLGENRFATALTNGASSAMSDSVPDHYNLRDLAASLLATLSRPIYTESTPTLKPRIARSLLKHLLAPTAQTLGTYYGALRGMSVIAGPEGVRVLILPNLRSLNDMLSEALGDEHEKERKKPEFELVTRAIVDALMLLRGEEHVPRGSMTTDEDQAKIFEKVGSLIGQAMLDQGEPSLNRLLLDSLEMPATEE